MYSTQHIGLKESGILSAIMCDFLDNKPHLAPFYTPFSHSNIAQLIEQKTHRFSNENRAQLASILTQQYQHITNIHTETINNIEKLKDHNTFTVTTGHQLCLFGGPLYFFYKIISTIKLTHYLSQLFPDKQFVPVFWMASEDHDFEEINHFYFRNKKFVWETKQQGAVGRMKTDELTTVFNQFSEIIDTENTTEKELLQLFEQCYLNEQNLSNATRAFVHHWFGKYGLVCIDGDNKILKSKFAPIIHNDIFKHSSYQHIKNQSKKLVEFYQKTQINARQINFFYLKDNLRQRIEKISDNQYHVINSGITFTKEDLAYEITNHPERFSPNVALRPLYQETILPNLAYIGGGGEVAYWLQLKRMFTHFNTEFPTLILRNSAVWLPTKAVRIIKKHHLNNKQLFLPEYTLLKQLLTSKNTVNFSRYETLFREQLTQLANEIAHIDPTLTPTTFAINAKLQKQLKQLEKKAFRSLKKQHQQIEKDIAFLHQCVFPNKTFQERQLNFSEIATDYTPHFLALLMQYFTTPTNKLLMLTPQ